MTLCEHEIRNLRNVLVRPFNGIPCGHQVLIALLSDEFASLYIFNIFTLMFCLRNKNNPPFAMIISNLYNPAVRFDASIRKKKSLPEFTIYSLQSIVYLLLSDTLPVTKFQQRKISLQKVKDMKRHLGNFGIVFFCLAAKNADNSLRLLMLTC